MESQTRNTESFDSRLGIELEIGLGLGICLNVKPCIESDSDSKFRPFGIFGIIGKPHMGVVFQKLGFHKNRDFAHFLDFRAPFWGFQAPTGT